jgi:hypothetical protein
MTTFIAVAMYHYSQNLFTRQVFKQIQYRNVATNYILFVCVMFLCRWFCLCAPVSSANKTDHHYTIEILVNVVLSTIPLSYYVNEICMPIFIVFGLTRSELESTNVELCLS